LITARISASGKPETRASSAKVDPFFRALIIWEASIPWYTHDAQALALGRGLSRAEEKRALKRKAWDLWLDCLTQREIAEQIGVDAATISRWIVAFAGNAEFATAPESPSISTSGSFRRVKKRKIARIHLRQKSPRKNPQKRSISRTAQDFRISMDDRLEQSSEMANAPESRQQMVEKRKSAEINRQNHVSRILPIGYKNRKRSSEICNAPKSRQYFDPGANMEQGSEIASPPPCLKSRLLKGWVYQINHNLRLGYEFGTQFHARPFRIGWRKWNADCRFKGGEEQLFAATPPGTSFHSGIRRGVQSRWLPPYFLFTHGFQRP
jgi:hypothetical protein